jgi:hypothetical protein
MLRHLIRPFAISAAVCTTACVLAPRCKAESPTLRRLRDNYEKNKTIVAAQNLREVVQWEPLRPYERILNTLDNGTIFDLSYMKVMYRPPLNETAKSLVYDKIIQMMNKAKTAEEEQMYVHLAKWYGIVD